ncbi:MAG: hypothetical protein ABI651_03260 [Verrucomicrobiota bacterium]
MKNGTVLLFPLCASLLSPGCATIQRGDYTPLRADQFEREADGRAGGIPAEAREKILALDPEHVSEWEITKLLSQMPAPRIITIQGGLLPIKSTMTSFARFLIGMGYPAASIRDPNDGAYTYGYYEGGDRIAGAIAWYYERDGLRPMIVGHSLGGIQAVRVLHILADPARKLSVWNPLTRSDEKRSEITDPLDGTTRPVTSVQVSYASAAVAGGLARILPNEWDMNSKLRKIPDSVEEFTGFHKGLDLLGGDFLGYGPANDYHPTGTAIVRNVRLPSAGVHSTIPATRHLLKNREIKDWINNYRPSGQGMEAPGSIRKFGWNSTRILWAAEVWHSIKKHWVLELQRVIRASLSQACGD